MKLAVCILLLCGLFLTAFAQPPGGYYSTCCPFDEIDECLDHNVPVDPRFTKQSCQDSEDNTGIPCATRKHFMQHTLDQLMVVSDTICPFNPFYAIIVRHNGPNINQGEIICEGLSDPFGIGPMWHGEMVAYNNCDSIILAENPGNVIDPEIWQKLTLYTTGEPCTMCMATSRWHKIGEVVYALNNDQLDDLRWFQVTLIPSGKIQKESDRCIFGNDEIPTSYQTRLIKSVLVNKINPYFAWQFDPDACCPPGCERDSISNVCVEED
jgi:tRNA(Arg) A34 adenosine deaminase TadA